jgi:hypothetical protein
MLGLQPTHRDPACTDIGPITKSSRSRDLLRAMIAQHGGVIDWTIDSAGWVVTLYLPEERTFCAGTLEDGLTTCLTWLLMSDR